jgi:ferritin-like metal-binding protein YciE
MPRLAKAVQTDNLRELLERRLNEGERVLKDVESALEECEETPGRKKKAVLPELLSGSEAVDADESEDESEMEETPRGRGQRNGGAERRAR